MKKVFRLEELDCANCARKMQEAVSKIDGVESVNISFMTQKMTIEADSERFEEILDEAQRLISRIEPDCRVVR